MLQRCSSGNNSSNASFSIIFPMSSPAAMDHETGVNMYSSSSSSFYSNPIASSVVDCTLSLGTPSTRHTNTTTSIQRSSCTKPSFCWDIINNATTNNSQYSKSQQTPEAANLMGADPLLLARRCANCDTTSTPLWRNGPRGPKSLCNACGIRYKKEERRAAASTASPTVVSATSSSTEPINYAATNYPSWTCYPAAASSATGMKNSTSPWCGQNEESNYFSWRLNVVPPSQFPVTDNRPSLFQYQ